MKVNVRAAVIAGAVVAVSLLGALGGCTASTGPAVPTAASSAASTVDSNATASAISTASAGEPVSAALAFVRSLGHAEIDRTTGISWGAPTEAQVGVGYLDPDGVERTVAVLRLQRRPANGPASDPATGSVAGPPWEVVDTVDGRLTLTGPASGAAVGPRAQVTGRLSGVDETVRVVIRSLPDLAVLGSAEVEPAPGTDVRWSVAVVLPMGVRGPALVEANTSGTLSPDQALAVRRIRLTG